MPRENLFRFLIFTVILAGAALLAGALPSPLHLALLQEDGPVESLSALSYLFAACWLLWQGRDRLACYWPAALLLVHLAVREAGLRSALLGGSGLSPAYYLNDALPLMQRAGAALLLLATLYALYKLVRALPDWLASLGRGDAAAFWLAGALGLGVLGQLGDKWDKLFGAAPASLMPYLLGFEEVFELGMALGMLVAAWRLLPAVSARRPALTALFLLSFMMLAGCQSPQAPVTGAESSVQHAFASRMLPMAAPAAESLGVSPRLVVAHAALESGWGSQPIRSADGEDSFNLFSLKATPTWQGRTVDILTTEYLRGRPVKRVERFRAYESYTDAFDDYARLLAGLTRYQGVLGAGDDERQFACALRRGGYATDPAYVEKLVRVSGFLKGLALPESSAPDRG